LNGETDLGHLSIVGLGEEFLGIGFLTAGWVGISPSILQAHPEK
jgi:hypothetical protein